MVGGVDAEQTWNLASKSSITVTANAPIRVYVSNGTRKVLVAEEIVSGTKTIEFDAVQGVKNATVINMCGGEVRIVEIGGSVTFGTKTVHAGNGTVKAEDELSYVNFNYATVRDDVHTNAFKDINNSACLYYSESGTFTLRPVWFTSESAGWNVELSIYYYDANGQKVEVPIYRRDSQPDMVQLSVNWSSDFQTYYDAHMPSLEERSDFTGTCRSRGIKVTVPAKTAFGFKILGGNDSASKLYSEGQYCVVPPTGPAENPGPYIGNGLGKYGHFAIINVDNRKYFGIDDFCELHPHSYDNPEYWHIVFALEGDLTDRLGDDPEPEPEPIGEDSSWILACEDLGDIADFDFNDVVLQITHRANATKAEVKLLAAGCTLHDAIYYGETCLGEVHELFGVQYNEMVNTFKTVGKKLPPVVMTVDVPANFSMSSSDMGGFSIRCEGTSAIVAAPGQGNVPYMICVPANWRWPAEMCRIPDAYPQFSAWCNDHTKNTDWYLTFLEENVY